MESNSKTDRIKQRNDIIRDRFAELCEKQRKRSDDALEILEREWLPLRRTTIWLIISKTGHYKNL